MGAEKAARPCGNSESAKALDRADNILARTYRAAGWILGLSFGLMFLAGVMFGWI